MMKTTRALLLNLALAVVALLALRGSAASQPIVQPLRPLDATTGYSANGYLFPLKLIQASDGNIYGTSQQNGSVGPGGTVFRVTPDGAVTVLHTFQGGATDGNIPNAGLIEASDGNFYGTTAAGGLGGVGVVFRMTPAGLVTVLHSFFAGAMEGYVPYSALVEGDDGNFYGTTLSGGDLGAGTSFPGTAFRITPNGNFTVIHSFVAAEGLYSQTPLVKTSDGSFVGIRESGGSFGYGAIFKMTPDGVVTVLNSFTAAIGGSYASIAQGRDGNFYGTIGSTLFRMTPDGTVTALHAFPGGTADGGAPNGLVQAGDGSFYGTTAVGGPAGQGVIFRITTSPVATYSIVYAFGTDQATVGGTPQGGLVLATDGSFYGMTTTGGAAGNGALFRVIVPAVITAPAPGSALSGSSVTFTWTTAPSSAYWLDVGTTPGGHDLFGQSAGLVTSQSVNGLPVLGQTLYVRLWTQLTGISPQANGSWRFNDYTYTALNAKAAMTSPSPGSAITGSNATFSWTPGTGASSYWLDVGTSVGQGNLFSGSTGLATSQAVSGLPLLGGVINVRLWTQLGDGSWQFNDYTYAAANAKAAMIFPAAGSTLAGSSVTFNWASNGSPTQYWLDVGTAPGKSDLFSQSAGLATSQTVNGLPLTGVPIAVRLWSQVNGSWVFNNYIYFAFNGRSTLTSPAPSSQLSGSTVTFTWSAKAGAAQYWLQVGSPTALNSLFDQSVGLATSQTVSGLPISGGTIVATIWTQIGGIWLSASTPYTAFDGRAAITSPAPNSTLSGSSVTFTWTPGTGATAYWLDVGTSFGTSDLFSQSAGLSTSISVTLPAAGAPAYVRLWTQINGVWSYNSYSYTMFNAKAVLTLPAPGPALTQSTVQFGWNAVAGASEYWLDVGTTLGSADVFTGSAGTSTSQTVSGIPTSADAIHVRLWTLYSGVWQYTDSMYGGHVITFGGVGSNGSPVTTYNESTFTVNATSGPWVAATTYGNPAPFIQFLSAGGTTTAAELTIVPSAGPFHFNSIDLYSSTTVIPYEITGTGPSGTVFTFTGTVPNTFGNFAHVTNPYSSSLVDQLTIKLTNPAAPCCSNPVGLDNINLSY